MFFFATCCFCALPADVGELSGEVCGVWEAFVAALDEPNKENLLDVLLVVGLATTGSNSGTISTPSSLMFDELLKMSKREVFFGETGSILSGGSGVTIGSSFFCLPKSFDDFDLGGGACATACGCGGGVTTTGVSFFGAPNNLNDFDLV